MNLLLLNLFEMTLLHLIPKIIENNVTHFNFYFLIGDVKNWIFSDLQHTISYNILKNVKTDALFLSIC